MEVENKLDEVVNLTPREKSLLGNLADDEQVVQAVKLRGFESRSKLLLMGNQLPPRIEVDHTLPTFEDALNRNRQIREAEARKKLRVMVIVPPDKKGNLPTANSGAWAPLGPWLVGSWAMQKGTDVKLVDGIITTEEEIAKAIREFQPDLTGFSVLTSGVEPAMSLSKVAKEVGSVVCWGNDHATQNADKTLARDKCVDVVIRGDGGDMWFGDLVEVMQGKQEIGLLRSASFRVPGGIRNNPFAAYDLSEEIVPDPLLVPRQQHDIYVRNFRRYWGHTFPREVTPAIISVARGCHWGASRCSYCDIVDLRPQSQNDSQKVWGWARMLVEKYGADLLYDGGADNMSSFARDPAEIYHIKANRPSWVEEMTAVRPADLSHLIWIINARADDITRPGVAQRLWDFGARRLQMGPDHYSDKILNSHWGVNKGNRNGAQTNKDAYLLMREFGFQGYLSHVLGLKGETPDTLKEFKEGISWTLDTLGPLVVTIGVSPVIPLKGTPIYGYLVENYPSFAEKYGGDSDTFDTTEMSKDATAILAPDVSWDELIETVNWTYARCYEREIHPATFTISGQKDSQGRMWLT